MIKTTPQVLDELYIIQDNLVAIRTEFNKGAAYDGYIDEKLSHIEEGCRYIRSMINKESENK